MEPATVVSRARLRWFGAAVAALALAAAIVFTTSGEDAPHTLSAASSGATTTSIEVTSTTGTTEAATTTTTRRPRTTVPTAVPPIAITIPLKPLELSHVDITVGAPCRDDTTTTTDGAAGLHEIDGCFFFVYWPLTQSDVRVTVLSDHGFAMPIPAPCQTYQGECQVYLGAVYDRTVGQSECFWLVSVDVGWLPLSNRVCVTWPRRP